MRSQIRGRDYVAELARGALLGRYVILGRIGSGAMGEVYAAYDPELDRKLAIKLLSATPGAGEDAHEHSTRLLREARAIAKLSHRNVVVVHDTGSFDGRVFIVMEFLEGSTLTVWLHAAPRRWQEVLDMFVAAGRGLQAAHEAGLLHRDFKPDNVMVCRDGHVRVMDFGLVEDLNAPAAAAAQADLGPSGPIDPDSTLELGRDTTVAIRREIAERGRALGATASPSPRPSQQPASDPPGSSDRAPTPIDEMYPGSSESPAGRRHTEPGALMGTPAYMSPEQFCGGELDARCDQYSFAVSLHQAMYGELPFRADTFSDLAANVMHGQPRPPPEKTQVPAWLRQAIRRGISRDPADRYPSMAALLAVLHLQPQRRRRRRILAGVAALSVVMMGGLLWLRSTGPVRQATCQVPPQRFDGVWEPRKWTSTRRTAIQTAFSRVDKDYARAVFGAVAERLDRYVGDWSEMYRDACVAAKQRGSESAKVLDLRMSCLNDRFDELRALSDVLVAANGQVVENAIQATMALGALDRCANVRRLLSTEPPPSSRASVAAIQVVRNDLSAAKALEAAGKSSSAIAALFEVVADARAIGYRPLLAETLLQLGSVTAGAGDPAAAETYLTEAVIEAQASHEDETLIVAMSGLISLRGDSAHDLDGAELWFRLASASLERFGGNVRLRALILANWAAALAAARHFEDALRVHEEALAQARQALGARHLQVGLTLAAIASVTGELGRYAEALRSSDQGVAIAEAVLGPGHPRLGRLLVERSQILSALGRYREARRDAIRSYDMWLRNFGSAERPLLSLPLAALGVAELGLGNPRVAISSLREAVTLGRQGQIALPVPDVELALARALWSSPRTRQEAVQVGVRARDAAVAVMRPTAHDREVRAAIDDWLAHHPSNVVAVEPLADDRKAMR